MMKYMFHMVLHEKSFVGGCMRAKKHNIQHSPMSYVSHNMETTSNDVAKAEVHEFPSLANPCSTNLEAE